MNTATRVSAVDVVAQGGVPKGTLEVSLSKSETTELTRPETGGKVSGLKDFYALLGAWAVRMADDGYKIVSEPEPGPGTMVWIAVKE